MPTLNYSVSVSGAGLTSAISKALARTADGGSCVEATIPHGYTGQLTTRTDNETGTITMDAGHAITTGMIVDLYWAGGARYGVTVGTVASLSVPIGADNSGTGDVLPTNLTEFTAVSQRIPFNASIDGDALSMLAIQMFYAVTSETAESHVILVDVGDAVIESIDLTANIPRVFDITGGDTNVFTGNPITDGFVSNASPTNNATLKLAWVQDITP